MIQQNLKPMTVSADTQLGGNVKPQNSNAQNLGNTLDRTYSVLEKMKTLSLQDPNDENTQNEQQKLQQEVNQLASEVSKLASSANSAYEITIDKLSGSYFSPIPENEYIREGATLSGATLSTGYVNYLNGELVYYIESGVSTEYRLVDGTKLNIYVNNNEYKELPMEDSYTDYNHCSCKDIERKVVIEGGQCRITGEIHRGDNTTIICDSYVFSPRVDDETGSVIFSAYGITFSIAKQDFYAILNSADGKEMNLNIGYYNELNSGSIISTKNLANMCGFNNNSMQIYGPDNFTSLIIYVGKKYVNGRNEIHQLQIQYSLANGTAIIDRISSENPITWYTGAGGFSIYFNTNNIYQCEYDSDTEFRWAWIKLETVNQLVKAGARRKYKMYKLL